MGGFESLIYAINRKKSLIRPNIERKLTGTLIRLHIGLEDVDDLIADLKAGFERLKLKQINKHRTYLPFAVYLGAKIFRLSQAYQYV